jgi:uncharacterized membrane protein YkvA (DUF1232 family)
LAFACRDPRTPWYAKAFLALVVGYALSPIDLIPDFIPVLGFLDDLVLVPAGVWLATKMVPAHVLAESRARAEATPSGMDRTHWRAAVVIVLVWVAASTLAGLWVWSLLH